jgi:hypothetical protein
MSPSLARAVLATFLAAAPLSAQTAHPGIGARVRAPSVLFDRFEGIYLGRSGDTLLFGDDERGPVRVPSASITQLELSGGKSRSRGAIRGAVVLGAIMAGLSAIMTSSNDTTLYNPRVDGSRGSFITETAVGGVFMGALVGVFIPVHVWRRADPQLFLNAVDSRHGPSLGVRLAMGYLR